MKKRPLTTLLFTAIAILSSHHTVFATHLRAADIVVERICGTKTFRIKIIAYLNSQSTTQFGTASFISFGDGSVPLLIPRTAATARPDLGPDISIATFETTHVYEEGEFTITYTERDRSSNILNIPQSLDVAYVTAVTINTSAKFGCNNYPRLTVVPLDRGCPGVAFYHSPGAVDDDGDSLSYHFSTPMSAENFFIPDYELPSHRDFYTDFETGNETNDGRPSIEVDTTGMVTWNAPEMIGEYSIAFNIVEWRRNSEGNFEKISTTVRDMQIIIEECTNLRPRLILPADLCVVAGTKISSIIAGTDPENHPVKIELFSLVLDLPSTESPATTTPDPPKFDPSDPPATVLFEWNTTCEHVRQQPYQVVVKITDDPPDGPELATFATWNIKVVAPQPELQAVTLDVVKNHGRLKWNKYTCAPQEIQVWRKVGSFPFRYDECFPGLPKSSGYSLIKALDPIDTTFIDTNNSIGLAPGATYCYRLIAIVNGTKSIVSKEICIGPVKRGAPVITHVSVEKTSQQGKIRVSWLSPIDLNREQFPPPYQYHLWRANGFYGDNDISKIHVTSDTTITDAEANSEDSVYNYRIVIYSKPEFSEEFIAVDTSAIASSVRLSANAGIGQISLQWRDSVPWSNVAFERPYHLIFRGKGIVDDADLQLIDSIQVIDNGFNYIDDGRFKNEPLEYNSMYTYKVMTIGTYGAPDIALQMNFSQKVFLYPENDLLPCTPITTIDLLDCDTYKYADNCNDTTFANTIHWTPHYADTCRIDIVSYRIYAADQSDGDYTLLATINATSYHHLDLESPMMCYRVSAIDSRGTEGPLSDLVCNDTCPYLELPNVFTPNNDGCNDAFTSWSQTSPHCEAINPYNCPRFVQSTTIKIYNRWGRQVYEYQSSDRQFVNVDWNGKDASGTDMATGVYYYHAEIHFDTLDKSQQRKTIKGWIHLMR